MLQEEIRNRINYNNQMIEKMLDPSIFILQPEVEIYMKENEELRSICEHQFKNGACIYCGKEEVNP